MPEIAVDSLISPAVLHPLLAALLGLAVGYALRSLSRRAVENHRSADDSMELKDLRKTIHLMQTENQKLSIFLMNLPDLARQLNSNTEKRKLPWLLVKYIEQLYDAQQIIIFLTTKDKGHLAIAAAKGLPDNHHRETVPIGKGRPGLVAQQQMTMDERDFAAQVHVGVKADLHPSFRTELCAPMVSNGQTLGVISVGGLLRRPKNEKNMLKMVADLGSIAMWNNILFHRIQNSANIDGLTSLHNKRYFMNKLAEELHKTGNEGSVSLFIFDIDHFKNYNDTNGHLAGDEALKIAGRLLKENVREDDLPARYGGEEFIVMLPGTDKKGAMAVAEKIRQVIEQHPFPNETSQPNHNVTVSGGVSTFPYDANDSSSLIRCADQALYQGKRSGRNKIFAYAPTYFSDHLDDHGTEDEIQCDTVKG